MEIVRYFVDDRVGCVAVVDRLESDSNYPGLHPDTKGVMKFWSKGRVEKKCPTCGHATSDWSDGDLEIAEANTLAHKLNLEHFGATAEPD